MGVAKSWGLPETLQRCDAHAPAATPPSRAVDKRRASASAGPAAPANEIVDALLAHEGETLRAQAGRDRPSVSRPRSACRRATSPPPSTRRAPRLAQLTQAMGLQMAPGSRRARLLVDERQADPVMDSLAGHQLQPTLVLDAGAGAAAPDAAAAGPPMAEVLAAGIQDITNSMVADNFKLNEVLRMVLETMYRALGFRRIVFCLRDPKTETLTGRFGLGDGARPVSKVFKVPLKPQGTAGPVHRRLRQGRRHADRRRHQRQHRQRGCRPGTARG